MAGQEWWDPMQLQKKGGAAKVEVPKIDALLKRDPHLTDHQEEIRRRYGHFSDVLAALERQEGGIEEFAKGHRRFGPQVSEDGTLTWLEWAPAAHSLHLTGEFNGWHRTSHPFQGREYGRWELVLPPKEGGQAIKHLEKVKILVNGEERVSPWASYVLQPSREKQAYDGVQYSQHLWSPPSCERHTMVHERPERPTSLRVYECHIGISSQQGRVNSYSDFTANVLPRIARQGYNTIQLMAVMEHAYYGSFGYQVTSFFAPSSRFGDPEDLRRLVDTAHGLGLTVLLDVVHSHASKNVADGLNRWDGSDAGYFHSGARGEHPLWDSRLFDYSSWESLRFLLSNLRLWIEDFGFDGFRFDGVTSMLYHHHGLGTGFSGDYHEYYGPDTDSDALVYLMLANHLVKTLLPKSGITVAEDVSGMPGLCRPLEEGGTGFDYRLSMAVPDMWIKYVKELQDEEWSMGHIVHTLTNRRYQEACIGYTESHDQALVGDKTLIFWLIDKEMYTGMSVVSPLHPVVERGMALHKVIRLLVHGLSGEGWLNFIGNEFGHPEWLDFPRAGNQESYHHARRQWNLVDDTTLRYQHLNAWDKEVNLLEEERGWLAAEPGHVSTKHEEDKVIVFERAGLLFACNLHPSRSLPDYPAGVQEPGEYRIVLDSDWEEFGGHNRRDRAVPAHTLEHGHNGRQRSMKIYLPCRTAVVYARVA